MKNNILKSVSKLLIFASSIILFSFISSEFSLINSIQLNGGEKFVTDKLSNLYVFNNNQIKKYDSDGKLIYSYSNYKYGDITSIDASNPMKIIVFYKDFSKIIFLDNTLSINGDGVNLSDLGYEQTSLSCSSSNNDIWLYDSREQQILKLNNNLAFTYKSGNLSQLLNINLNPNYFLFQNDLLFLNNPEIGIFIFDAFGTYLKTIPIKELQSFQVIGDNLYYCSNKTFKSFNIKTFEEKNYTLPDSSAQSVRIEQKRLYILKDKKLEIYSINSKN